MFNIMNSARPFSATQPVEPPGNGLGGLLGGIDMTTGLSLVILASMFFGKR